MYINSHWLQTWGVLTSQPVALSNFLVNSVMWQINLFSQSCWHKALKLPKACGKMSTLWWGSKQTKFSMETKDKNLTMMPNTMVEKNPPMNPSHVFLGDSCRGHSQGVNSMLIYHHVPLLRCPEQKSTLRPLCAAQCRLTLPLQAKLERRTLFKYLVALH